LIPAYVEYTGTALQTILKEERTRGTSEDDVFDRVEEAYAEQFSCRIFPPFGFENTYALAVPREKALQAGWGSISGISLTAPDMLAGFTAEFIERPDGLPGLRAAYGIRFKRVVDLLPDLMYSAVAEGEVDVICAFSTDGRILKHDLQILTDDRGFFPPYEACPVARSETLTRHPALATALLELRDTIDVETMTRLNNEADEGQKTPAEIAEFFLGRLR
jgi:osmoprotectant transport system permease protein